MNAAQTPAPTHAETAASDAAALVLRLTAILLPLAVLVAARFRLLGQWTVPIWTRLNRLARRLPRLFARAPEPRPRTAPRPARAGGPPPLRLPGGQAWLLARLRHEAAVYTQRLEAMFAEPGTVALLAAAPAALGALRPVCRLLGATLPPALRPPRKPRPPAAPAAAPVPAPRPARAPAPPPPPDGCWCSNPSASPFWPFAHAIAPPTPRGGGP